MEVTHITYFPLFSELHLENPAAGEEGSLACPAKLMTTNPTNPTHLMNVWESLSHQISQRPAEEPPGINPAWPASTAV